MINLDIKKVTDRILSENTPPSYRLKEMYAIVTGMGRGKTRFLLEIDRALKKIPEVVSVAIRLRLMEELPTHPNHFQL